MMQLLLQPSLFCSQHASTKLQQQNVKINCFAFSPCIHKITTAKVEVETAVFLSMHLQSHNNWFLFALAVDDVHLAFSFANSLLAMQDSWELLVKRITYDIQAFKIWKNKCKDVLSANA